MKKLLLFILLELICLCLILGGLYIKNNSMNFTNEHDTTIEIVNGDTSNDTLTLNPGIMPDVYKGRKVTWNINPSSNVESFRLKRKDKTDHIFIISPLSDFKKEISGTVYPRYLIADDRIYNYYILWKKKGDPKVRTFDPKLAVKSTGFTTLELLIYILSGALFLFPFTIFRTKKTRKK